MLTLTTQLTGGQWLLPVIILIVLNSIIYQYASKNELDGLKKFILIIEFLVFFAIIALFWIIYAKGRTELYNAVFATMIFVETSVNQLMDLYSSQLKNKFGDHYSWFRFAFDCIMMLILAITLLMTFHFHIFAWIATLFIFAMAIWDDFYKRK